MRHTGASASTARNTDIVAKTVRPTYSDVIASAGSGTVSMRATETREEEKATCEFVCLQIQMAGLAMGSGSNSQSATNAVETGRTRWGPKTTNLQTLSVKVSSSGYLPRFPVK